MKNKKKKLIAILLALTCLFVVVVGAYAAFDYQYSQKTRNIITTGGVDIELKEFISMDAAGSTPFPTEGVNVMPGSVVPKIIQVENTGASPAWVRVKVDKEINLVEGQAGTPDLSLVTITFDSTKWTYNEAEGCYYYSDPLAPGDTTDSLPLQVTFAASMDNMYQSSTAKVNVQAQAVQTANNGETVTAALGWPSPAPTEGGD